MNFIEYITKKGFKPYHYDCKSESLIEGAKPISSLDNLDIRYIKGDKVIYYGLETKGLPPHVFYPKHTIAVRILEYEDKRVYISNDAHAMSRLFKKYSNEEIFEAMFDKNIVLELDNKD